MVVGYIMSKIRCVILGSSGLVSQHLQALLNDHPWFSLHALAGSTHRVGTFQNEIHSDVERPFSTVTSPILPIDNPDIIQSLKNEGVKIAFSTLPSVVAMTIEPLWAEHGIIVFSNSSAFRCRNDVPTIVPEVNHEHYVKYHEAMQYCATNCTLLSFLFALHPLVQRNVLDSISVTTEQAISGGGLGLLNEVNQHGLSSREIPGEAEKIVNEFHYLTSSDVPLEVQCQRVDRRDGHLVHIHLVFNQPVSILEFQSILKEHNKAVNTTLPSSPKHLITIQETVDVERDHWSDGTPSLPSVSSDLTRAHGMSTIAADFLQIDQRTIHFSGYSHNLIRGAAGGVLLLAEFAHAQGRFLS